jgi:hypothetical protein
VSVSNGKAERSHQEEAVATAESAPTRSRKHYLKPAFRYERVFETMALSCGKLNPTQFQCTFHSKTS